MKTIIAFLLLLTGTAFGQLNVTYQFNNIVQNPVGIAKATLIPVMPLLNYNGIIQTTNGVSQVTGTNTSVTFTNVIPGYIYIIQLSSPYGNFTQTNAFPTNLTGNINGPDWKCYIINGGAFVNGQWVGNMVIAYQNQTNFPNAIVATNPGNVFIGNGAGLTNITFSGNGAGLTNLAGTNLIGPLLATNPAIGTSALVYSTNYTTNIITTNIIVLSGAGLAEANATWTWNPGTTSYTNGTPGADIQIIPSAGNLRLTNGSQILYLTINSPTLYTQPATWNTVSGTNPAPTGVWGSNAVVQSVVVIIPQSQNPGFLQLSNGLQTPYIFTGSGGALTQSYPLFPSANIGGINNFELGLDSVIAGGTGNTNMGAGDFIGGSGAVFIRVSNGENAAIATESSYMSNAAGVMAMVGVQTSTNIGDTTGAQIGLQNGYADTVSQLFLQGGGINSYINTLQGFEFGSYVTNAGTNVGVVGDHIITQNGSNTYSFGFGFNNSTPGRVQLGGTNASVAFDMNGNITFIGTIQATSGANLTAIPAANLTGTILPAQITNASFAPTLAPTFSGANLTSLPASNPSTNYAPISGTLNLPTTNLTFPAGPLTTPLCIFSYSVGPTTSAQNVVLWTNAGTTSTNTLIEVKTFIASGNGTNNNQALTVKYSLADPFTGTAIVVTNTTNLFIANTNSFFPTNYDQIFAFTNSGSSSLTLTTVRAGTGTNLFKVMGYLLIP